MNRCRSISVLLVLATLSLAPTAFAADQCFPETNHCLRSRFEEYWRLSGGLSVFGYPITDAADEVNRDTGQTYNTQWLERNRFELHSENQAPYDVLLGRLGDDRLRQTGVDWQTQPKGNPATPHYFAATGFGIGHEPFWQYWSSHGLELGDRGVSERESLALFGLPITDPKMETNSSGDTVLTQWFERARFEYHPDKPDPYKVLLGLLGNEVRANLNPGTVPPPPPPPTPNPSPSAAPTPAPLPPSFNNCAEDPNKDRAPNNPVRMTVNKVSEIVTLTNVSGAPVNMSGWRICSIRGNQLHATLSQTIAPGQSLDVPSQAGANIWSNSEDDDGALYDANGSLVSYSDD